MSSEKQMQFRCFFSLAISIYILHRKNKMLFLQIIWLLQLCDCPSCAYSKNVVLVKHFVGG